MNTIPRFSNPDPILIFDPISDPISAYSVSLHGCWTDSWTWHLQNWIQSLQVCSVVVQSLGHVWLLDCSTPGFPVLQYLLEFAQIHVHWIGDAIQPSSPLPPPYPFAFNLSQHQGLFMSQLFASGGQSIGASAWASVLPMNIQNWFPLGLIGLIFLVSKGLSEVFTTI